MKKTVLLLILSLFTFVAFANSPVNFGLNFRINMPKADFDEINWTDVSGVGSVTDANDVLDESETGYAGGVFLRFNKNKTFLHSEAMFSFNTTGFSATDDAGSPINFASETTTFNVPVFLGRNMINTKIFKIRAFTGPSFSWLMKSESTDASGNVIDDVALSEFDWRWAVGGGVELFMLSLDVRYGFDLQGVEGSTSLQNSFNQSTNMLEFTLGFKFF